MGEGDLPADGQTEAHTASGAPPSSTHLMEAFEDGLALVLGDARPAVGHGEEDRSTRRAVPRQTASDLLGPTLRSAIEAPRREEDLLARVGRT